MLDGFNCFLPEVRASRTHRRTPSAAFTSISRLRGFSTAVVRRVPPARPRVCRGVLHIFTSPRRSRAGGTRRPHRRSRVARPPARRVFQSSPARFVCIPQAHVADRVSSSPPAALQVQRGATREGRGGEGGTCVWWPMGSCPVSRCCVPRGGSRRNAHPKRTPRGDNATARAPNRTAVAFSACFSDSNPAFARAAPTGRVPHPFITACFPPLLTRQSPPTPNPTGGSQPAHNRGRVQPVEAHSRGVQTRRTAVPRVFGYPDSVQKRRLHHGTGALSEGPEPPRLTRRPPSPHVRDLTSAPARVPASDARQHAPPASPPTRGNPASDSPSPSNGPVSRLGCAASILSFFFGSFRRVWIAFFGVGKLVAKNAKAASFAWLCLGSLPLFDVGLLLIHGTDGIAVRCLVVFRVCLVGPDTRLTFLFQIP